MARQISTVGDSRIIYDPDLVNPVSEAMFDPNEWPDATTSPAHSGGRGKTVFIPRADQDWVLRHYYRGGMIGRWLTDTYFWLGASRSRPFTEWLLLDQLVEMDLPVPSPVAARLVRTGPVYRGDLITVRIPGAESFSHRWVAGTLHRDMWWQAGELIGRFHQHRVYHADLNAHNIQVDNRDELYLLDFDRGKFMPGGGGWMQRNLARLKRSLQKISRTSDCELSDEDWNRLLAGYGSAV